tara:strand:+ start:2728 stop:3153 length:426 start_codon:yes stop_codon:yes gene_type:complete
VFVFQKLLTKLFIYILIIFISSASMPTYVYASHLSEIRMTGLTNKISNIFSRKYCNFINNGYSKDEAMNAAIKDTENVITFSINPQAQYLSQNKLADQIAIKVVSKCGWSFGLIGKRGIHYFKNYFLEVSKKISPNRNLSG